MRLINPIHLSIVFSRGQLIETFILQEVTIFKKSMLKRPYILSILSQWNSQNYHTNFTFQIVFKNLDCTFDLLQRLLLFSF